MQHSMFHEIFDGLSVCMHAPGNDHKKEIKKPAVTDRELFLNNPFSAT